MLRLNDANPNTVFHETQLFQTFRTLIRRARPRREGEQTLFPIGVKTNMSVDRIGFNPLVREVAGN